MSPPDTLGRDSFTPREGASATPCRLGHHGSPTKGVAMVEPDTPCLACSKPIQPGTGIALECGGAVHIRCLSGNLRLRAMEAQSTAAKLVVDADELIGTARALAKCVFCAKPLASGSVLFSGKRLVHAACWRPPGAPGVNESSPGPDTTAPETPILRDESKTRRRRVTPHRSPRRLP